MGGLFMQESLFSKWNGYVRRLFRLNQAYGPNCQEYGVRYDADGKLLFRGKFGVSQSGLGWPKVYEPKESGAIPQSTGL